MSAIEVKDIHKNYKGAWAPALDGFSFFVSMNTSSLYLRLGFFLGFLF